MNQEFYFHQSGTAFGEEVQQGDKAELDTTADNDDQRESEVSEETSQQPMNNAYVNMYHHPSPPQNGYWMRENSFRRPPSHGGYHGGGHPGFYGFGVPFLGGLASGLLLVHSSPLMEGIIHTININSHIIRIIRITHIKNEKTGLSSS